jgi:transcriptional regulator
MTLTANVPSANFFAGCLIQEKIFGSKKKYLTRSDCTKVTKSFKNVAEGGFFIRGTIYKKPFSTALLRYLRIMYIPGYFRNKNLPELEAFIRQNPFAILINQREGKPWATHLPVELEENETGEKVLWCHVARANQQWKNFETNPDALLIFSGPHHYISSSWYNHINVPTWNYIAVHVYGKVQIMGEERFYEALKRLMSRYEAASKNPQSIENLPQDFVRKQLHHAVGFEISITRMEGKWKLSQNRDNESAQNVIRELEELNDYNATMIAEEMKKLRS